MGLEHIAFDWRDAMDIAVVSVLLYQVIQMLRSSRALAVLTGLGLLTVLYFVSNILGLYTLTWLLQHIFSSLFILIVVIFQSDIRQALGEMGASRLFRKRGLQQDAVEEVVAACVEMARLRVGALIVVERSMRLGDMIERGGRPAFPPSAHEYFLPQGSAARRRGHFEPREDHSGRLHSALSRGQRAELWHTPPRGPGHYQRKRRRGHCGF